MSIYFDPPKFEDFFNDPINKVKIVMPIVKSGFHYTFDVIKGNAKFKYLFACFNSFDRHKTRKRVVSKQKYIEYE